MDILTGIFFSIIFYSVLNKYFFVVKYLLWKVTQKLRFYSNLQNSISKSNKDFFYTVLKMCNNVIYMYKILTKILNKFEHTESHFLQI